jgi:predicted Zn finger-like uncharacterized protein
MPAPEAAPVVIACPHCGTRYQVPYGAIGPRGRNVACAHCGRSWQAHADPPSSQGTELPPQSRPARNFSQIAEEVLDEQFEIEERRHQARRAAALRAEEEERAARQRERDKAAAIATADAASDVEAEAAAKAKALARAGQPAAGAAAVAEPPPDLQALAAAIAPRQRAAAPPEPAEADPVAEARREREFWQRQRELHNKLPVARLRRTARLVAGLGLLAVLAGGVLFRVPLVTQFPALAGVYAALGLGVNVVGLDFRGVRTLQALHDGVSVLTVSGDIAGVGGTEVPVPQVVVTLLGPRGDALYQWAMLPKATELRPGDTVPFEARLSQPPAGAVSVRLSFGTGRKLSAADTLDAADGGSGPAPDTPAAANQPPPANPPGAADQPGGTAANPPIAPREGGHS